jgi:hypothetical protein
MKVMHIAAASPRRAHRYEIRTDVRFRPVAVLNWQLGQTENISDTGLLVRSPEPLPVNTPIQLELYAPIPLSGVSSAPLICIGRVVRSMREGDANGEVRIAIAVQADQVSSPAAQPAPPSDERLRDACHLLTNQLAVVYGTTELLLTDDKLDPEVQGRLRSIKSVVTQAAVTVKKLVS